MIRFEHTEVQGFEHALRGMRNPLNSWAKSDSRIGNIPGCAYAYRVNIGDADRQLCERLIRAGTEHCKFLRQIICWTDITAPRMWWIEFDTYRFGVEKNSCSTMHTIMQHPFSDDDFGCVIPGGVIADLNRLRILYADSESEEERKHIWRQLIDRLPQSYHQKRTVMMSYQAIRSMYHQRAGHKLSEWAGFRDWAVELPESWMVSL